MAQSSTPSIIYPFKDMTRGDSFFVPSLSILKDVVVIYERAKQANKVVQCIDVLENGMLGIRVYCIK